MDSHNQGQMQESEWFVCNCDEVTFERDLWTRGTNTNETTAVSHLAFSLGLEKMKARACEMCSGRSVVHLAYVCALRHVCLTLRWTLRGRGGNWNTTELSYKYLTGLCVYSKTPDAPRVSTYFLLISFSFASLRLESIWISVSCEAVLCVAIRVASHIETK